MSATNPLEKSILKHVLLGNSISAITPYMGLSVANPGEDAGALDEPVIGGPEGYSRVDLLLANGIASAWTTADIDAASGSVLNANDIIFPTATGDWGTLAYWFIANSSSGVGTGIIAYGALTTPRTVVSGEQPIFAAGSFTMEAQ